MRCTPTCVVTGATDLLQRCGKMTSTLTRPQLSLSALPCCTSMSPSTASPMRSMATTEWTQLQGLAPVGGCCRLGVYQSLHPVREPWSYEQYRSFTLPCCGCVVQSLVTHGVARVKQPPLKRSCVKGRDVARNAPDLCGATSLMPKLAGVLQLNGLREFPKPPKFAILLLIIRCTPVGKCLDDNELRNVVCPTQATTFNIKIAGSSPLSIQDEVFSIESPWAQAFALKIQFEAGSYKRVKGRSHTVEKRKTIHPQKPHVTSQPASQFEAGTFFAVRPRP